MDVIRQTKCQYSVRTRKDTAVRFQPLLPDKNISIVAHDIAACCTDVSWEIGRSKRVIVTTSELKKGSVLEFK